MLQPEQEDLVSPQRKRKQGGGRKPLRPRGEETTAPDSQNAYGDKTTRICIGNDTKEWLAAFVKTHNLKSIDEGLQELLKLHP